MAFAFPGCSKMYHLEPFARLIDELSKMPTVGPKTAQRLAFYILQVTEEEAQSLADAIINAKKKIVRCSICNNISDSEICYICNNPQRDRNILCVVSEAKDVIALEKTREYKGRYHVLGGNISPIDGIGPENLTISKLLHRVKTENFSEIILATNPSIAGEATALYLTKILKPLVKVTRLAYGLPVGSDLEYADEITLIKAMEGRIEL